MSSNQYNFHKYTKVALYVQSSISLVLCFILFLFISLRKNLRSRRCNQLFLNILLVHSIFNIAAIATETEFPGHLCIVVHNTYFLGLLVSLILLCIERILLVKYPIKHRKLSDDIMSAVVTFSWVPCILLLLDELINERNHIQHLLMFRVILIVVGEILLTSLNFAIYHHANHYDKCVKEHPALPQQSELMLNLRSLCIDLVAFCSLLWLPYLVVDLLVLEGVLDVQFVFLIQHFTPLCSLIHIIVYLYLSTDIKEELKDFFKETGLQLSAHFAPREPKIFTLESLVFTKNHTASRRDGVADNQSLLRDISL